VKVVVASGLQNSSNSAHFRHSETELKPTQAFLLNPVMKSAILHFHCVVGVILLKSFQNAFMETQFAADQFLPPSASVPVNHSIKEPSLVSNWKQSHVA